MKSAYSFVLLLALCSCFSIAQVDAQTTAEAAFWEVTGEVKDANTNEPLIFASITVEGTSVSTITNSEGNFSLKIPYTTASSRNIHIQFLGYQPATIPVSVETSEPLRITLTPSSIALEEVNLTEARNAKDVVMDMLKVRERNYSDNVLKMTAFYRETIKKRRKDASLAEAVVTLYKQPYNNNKQDVIELYKSRKTTDYDRLDTIALKLQGGPYTPVFNDLMKYPEYIFGGDQTENYYFSFDRSTVIEDTPVYVIAFRQKETIETPLYSGKLFIEKSKKALVSAVFNMNLENREEASRLLVRKKPARYTVYPEEAAYRVDYRKVGDQWQFSYGNVQLTFVVDQKGRLFNSKYSVSSEIAVTNFETMEMDKPFRIKKPLRTSVILADEASGFADPDFWGEYNVIEPEESIQSAIKKIQRQLEREERRNG